MKRGAVLDRGLARSLAVGSLALLHASACKKEQTHALLDAAVHDASTTDASTNDANAQQLPGCINAPAPGTDPWFRCLPTPYGKVHATSIAYRTNGNIVVAGAYDPAAIVDADYEFPASGFSFFLIEYTPEGVIEWTATANGGGPQGSISVAVGDDNEVYVSGTFQGLIIFSERLRLEQDDHALVSDIFTAKFAPDTGFVWARRWGGSSLAGVGKMLLADDGGIIVSGLTYAMFGPFGPAQGNLIGKFSPTGSQMWMVTTNGEDAPVLGRAPDGDILASTYIRRGTTFNDVTYNASDEHALLKLSEDGDVRWVRTLEASPLNCYRPPFVVGSLENGHILIAGATAAPTDSLGCTLTLSEAVSAHVSEPSLYFAELDAAGNALGVDLVAATGTYGIEDSAIDANGNVTASGWYVDGDVRFGTETMPDGTWSGRGLALRFDSSGTLLGSMTVDAIEPWGAQVRGLAVGPNDRTALVGFYTTRFTRDATTLEGSGSPWDTATAFVYEGTDLLR